MENFSIPQDPEDERRKKIFVRVRLAYWCVLGLLIGIAPLLAFKGIYGWLLFTTIPFSIGILSSLLQGLLKQRTLRRMLLSSLIPLGVLIIGALVFASEGLICVLMSIPVVVIPLLLGAALGYVIQKQYWNRILVFAAVFFLNGGAYVYDTNEEEFSTIFVQDEIQINAGAEVAWNKISGPFEFGAADNFFLSNGVSFPLSMQLKKENDNCFLLCSYNNGFTKARVDSVIPGKLIRFTLTEPPVSMKETSLYSEVEPKHIRGRILVDYGSFKIVSTGSNTSKLIATTQLRSNIGPKFYWEMWASYLIRRMHEHVLTRIKTHCEK